MPSVDQLIIIPVKKPSSNPFKTLSVKKGKHKFVE